MNAWRVIKSITRKLTLTRHIENAHKIRRCSTMSSRLLATFQLYFRCRWPTAFCFFVFFLYFSLFISLSMLQLEFSFACTLFFVDFLFLFSTNLVILMIVGKSLLIKYFRSSTWKSTNRYLATAKNNAIAATMWFLFYLAAFDGSRKKQITENCSRLLGSRWPEQEVAKKTTINCYTIFSEKNEWPETEDKREQSFCLLSMEIR